MSHTASVLPHEIGTLLDRFPNAKILSLDCFDTLLWRDCHAPSDIFSGLPGISIKQRAASEKRARTSMRYAGKGSEVSIGQIYAKLMPNASAAQRNAAIAAELAAEARHCYGFAPVVDLMRTAKASGLQVIIVSDTYLDEKQLAALIADAAGEDVAGLIDRYFCSSRHGLAKAQGLYEKVLRKLNCPPEAIVHLGDNFDADVGGVAPLGVNAVHLQQFTETARERLRLEAGVDAMIHPRRAGTVGAILPHRAAIAIGEPQIGNSAQALGATVLGPVLHAYEAWLREEAEALAQQHGAKVHWLFLMRDGHLPQRVHELDNEDTSSSHAAELSRLTATAAHFTDNTAIADFVDDELGQRPETLARQLLMPEAQIETLLGGQSIQDGSIALLRESRKGPFRKATIRASREHAARMEAHIRKVCDPAPGDVLMLVDLGYNGTVQNRIDAVLRERMGVHVAGRFLLLREQDSPGLDKRGLIDIRNYPLETLEAMCGNVALLEQLCTKAQGSVIGYEEDGTPIRRENDIKEQQSDVREQVQQGALAFQRWARNVTLRADETPRPDAWRQAAASVLMRSMFLPLPSELAVVESFEHDINLGTGRAVAMFDRTIAETGLRQRGLFYMNGSERMYLPAEVAGQTMATRLSLLAHRRFNLPFTYTDFAGAPLDLGVVFVDGENASRQQVPAYPTHDGFYTAAIPIGRGQFTVAPLFAELCEWVEIERLEFVAVDDFVSGSPEVLRESIAAKPLLDRMERASVRLFDCRDPHGQMLIPPPADPAEKLLLAATFRPIGLRDPAVAAAAKERLSA